ncbi:type I polyketide synthase [Gloeocapsopsis dulcis]|uniref:Phenolphthiocerol/phthiocerol polyketide synthase subunit E n=2 Tax=Gloeocapsopsis TaxID=693222 RepID=A0A6N8G5H8_9CHRO|nr:type I polyketide synthase [Gloeocapsopsis dulcis]MUL39086.1 polyketide synthase [Gloeocapsopsis dulcis AAB1 = 1H9]WNN92351.1 beta-ketoacyl synthase N-terminal-like domain-containing protein [Gloeocapsopsis dulcis]
MSNQLKGIAIIGMAGRFPGAKSVNEFWQNLCNGVESISHFSDEELLAAGVDPADLSDRNYVKAGFVLEDIEKFDAAFFGFSPREAELLDPQQRVFLECAWEALENAGYNPKVDNNFTGLYAGGNLSTYLFYNLASHPELLKSLHLPITLGNDKDFIPTRVSYKLNLKGPSVNVGTACSTSLVAVHLACRGLLSYQCDMALAGGVAIQVPQVAGYFYEPGGMASADAHTRTFDAKATGGPFGRGAGVVVLKRLADAVADGDYIYGVIKGSAINNDGAMKVSYTAPSVNGQAEVIAEAQAIASFAPETITYIETHGTATALGDPIEIRALEKVFRAGTNKKGFCAIGSVKTNVSHLNTAAGVTSLIKTALALKCEQIPPSLYFEEPSPEIDFANSPFYVNTQLSAWPTNGTPRRAGVSSFGLGGTNAHVVLEEAPEQEQGSREAEEQGRNYQLLVLSAKTNSALEAATANLINHLQQHPELNLADVAYTLQVGRHPFNHRRTVVCQDIPDAIVALQNPKRVLTSTEETNERPVAFMFTGLGTQYINMTEELYQVEPTFREHIDLCCSLFQPLLGVDLKQVIYPTSESTKPEATTANPGIDLRQMLGRNTQPADPTTQKLNQTSLTQPALFTIEYALAQLWMSWGMRPVAMIGYSLGEYVAATLAGVLSLKDAVTLVAKRAQMIQELPSGAMLAVPLSEEEVQPFLSPHLSLSAINGASQCVLAGTIEAVRELEQQLTAKGVACRRLQTSHAFHSFMMQAIADSFTALVQTINFKPPQTPYLSNVTGTWITPEQATNPSYWTQHMCQPVRFADGVNHLWKQRSPVLLEIGAGQALSSLAMQCLDNVDDELVILSSLRYAYERQSDVAFILNTLGQLWLAGAKIDWSGFHTHERRYRLPLPTYPFERQRYWIEPQKLASAQSNSLPKLTVSELWQSLIASGQLQASAGARELDEPISQEKREYLDRLCIAYINLALTNLGAFSNPSKRYSLEELLNQCQIIPPYRELLCRWLEILVEQGQLKQEQGLFTNFLPISTNFVNELLVKVRAIWADTLQQIDLLQLYGENMVALLTGKKEPLEFHVSTLLKSGEFSVQQLPENKYYNSIMRVCLEEVLKSLPHQVNLRILEIGAGTGTGTAELLPILSSEKVNYTFTDVGGFFLNAAKNKFSDYPFVEYKLLDIERSPQEQGYTRHSFDVIVAFQVLHVARNIGETLDHIRSLLAPGGLLLFWETTQPRMEFEFIDALLMNPIEDSSGDRNMCNPFLSQEQWQAELKSHGFVQVTAFSNFAPFTDHIIVAQATTSATHEVPAAFTASLNEQDTGKTQEVSLGKQSNVADWFYIPSWKRSLPPQSNTQVKEAECWLVFVDEYGLGAQIVKRLELEGHKVITVTIGEQFGTTSESSKEQIGKCAYTIAPQQHDDYNTLLKELRAQDLIPQRIIHLWSVTQSELGDFNTTQGFQSLLLLTQALGKQNFTDELQLVVISNNMQAVTGVENLCPEKATVLGLVKVIPQEYSNIKCRSIDITVPSPGSWQEEKFVNQLLTELKGNSLDSVIAYRSWERWVQTFEPVQLAASIPETPKLREKGVYLITGGLEDIGIVVAEHLAKTVQAKLLILEAEDFPHYQEWEQWLTTHDEQDNISCKILKAQELEKLGAEVLIKNVDLVNLAQMQSAIAQIQEHFGQLNGVFHTAKIPIEKLFTPIAEIEPTECEQQFQQKRQGLLVLEEILQFQKLDFCLLMSSLTSILGGLGSVGYSAVSLLMDAFTYQYNQKNPVPWMSINWDAWQFRTDNQEIFASTSLAEFAIQPQEGINALERILLWSQYHQIVVSTGNLQSRIDQWIKLESLQEKTTNRQINLSSRHSRPNLKNAYVAPSNDVERKLADIFQELLGIEPIGIHDNFFALGGDSLTGTVLISQVRKHFQVELPIRSLFEAPTVAELALVIEEILIEEIEQLSADEERDKTLDVQLSN